LIEKAFKYVNSVEVLKGEGEQGYFRDPRLAIVRASWFVIWRNNIPWSMINMRAVNREELKGLPRILNLPIFYPNLWMFTFKTRPKFNINVKKWINSHPAVVFLEVSSFHRKRRSRIPSHLFVDFVNHRNTLVIFRDTSQWLIVL
jgi:hypothetical protein